jgi:hypothetical protein
VGNEWVEININEMTLLRSEDDIIATTNPTVPKILTFKMMGF